MANLQRAILARAVVAMIAAMGLCNIFTSLTFVPPADIKTRRSVHVPLAQAAGGAAAILGACKEARADAVDEAAANLAAIIYPILDATDWVKGPLTSDWLASRSMQWAPIDISQASEKLLDAALSMNPALVTKAVVAHEAALKAAYRVPNLMCPVENLAQINSAIARMLASAGPEKNQAIYNTFGSIGFGEYSQMGYKTVDPAVAAAGYKAWLELVQAAAAAAA